MNKYIETISKNNVGLKLPVKCYASNNYHDIDRDGTICMIERVDHRGMFVDTDGNKYNFALPYAFAYQEDDYYKVGMTC